MPSWEWMNPDAGGGGDVMMRMQKRCLAGDGAACNQLKAMQMGQQQQQGMGMGGGGMMGDMLGSMYGQQPGLGASPGAGSMGARRGY
jgi:hypothetical protein